MHPDRHLFLCPRTQPPPKTSQHTSGTQHRHPPVRCTPLPKKTHLTKQKRHIHSQTTHTTPRSDPRVTPVNKRREAKTTSILTKQQKTKIQKFGPNTNPPANTKTKSKRTNDKKTQKPKRDQSQKLVSTQPYQTKAHNLARSKNVPNTNICWPTSCSSSEFSQNYIPHHSDLRQRPNSQINFPTDQHSNTMPTTKIDVIRLQQAAVVTNLVEIARYTQYPYSTGIHRDDTRAIQQNDQKPEPHLKALYSFYPCTSTRTTTSTESRPLCPL
jgi:hypothetical protein